MIRCAITEGTATPAAGSEGLLSAARRWAAQQIDFVQLREKSLPAADLLALASALLGIFRQPGCRTRLLINSRADIALAARADGVHLTAHPGELTPAQVGQLFQCAGFPEPVISISCHTLAEVDRLPRARAPGPGSPNLILFGPVFEKRVHGQLIAPGTGLETLRQACALAAPIPVLALGGITAESTAACLDAGAAGVAAIRLFAS